jgi:hypothetical protein
LKPSIVRTRLPNKDYGVNAGINVSISAERELLDILSGAKMEIDETADYKVIETYDPIHDVTSFKVSKKEESE